MVCLKVEELAVKHLSRGWLLELRSADVGEVVEPAGADTFVLLNLSSKEVTARLKAETSVQPGQEMEFAFNMDKVSYFDVDSGERIN